jgi:ABC-type sugar transport system substrate-binding protein
MSSRVSASKRLGGVAAAVVATTVIAACGSSGSGSVSGGTTSSGSAASSPTASTSTSTSTSGSAVSASGKITVGYVLAAPVSALEAIGSGVQKEAAALGMNFIEESADFSADQQISAMQALEAKHVNVIISAPLVPASFFQAATNAQKQGIDVLTYNKAGTGVSYAVTNPDTEEATSIVGVLATHLKSEGKPCDIGIIEGQPTAPPLEARDLGFSAGAKASGCTVLASQVATTTTAQEGSTIADGWKTRFGSQMTGIVVINDDVALGVLPARGGQFSPAVVSLNGEPAAIQAVQNGTLYADGGLENAIMGMSLAIVAHDLATKQPAPTLASSPYYLLTQQTVGAFVKTYADATVLAAPLGKVSFVKQGGQTVVTYAPS